MTRPRRAIHFVPGGNDKMLSKALGLAADTLILDLEDAVAPDRKADVRSEVAEWLRTVDFGRQERAVRINPLDSPWGYADIAAMMATPPDVFVVPKVGNRGEIEQLDRVISKLEEEFGHPDNGVKLLLIGSETAPGALNLPDYANHARVAAVTWGAEDLSAELGSLRTRDANGNYLDVFRYCRSTCLLGAVAAQVQPIDAVFVDFKDLAGLRRECDEGAAMGFTGKITIHPSQVDIVNDYFTPSVEQVAEAEAILAAFEEHHAAGAGAFTFNGSMVDAPHLKRARTILDRAKAVR